MNATITIKQQGNRTRIMIRRAHAFKSILVSASEAPKHIRHYIITLSNMGYDVKVEE